MPALKTDRNAKNGRVEFSTADPAQAQAYLSAAFGVSVRFSGVDDRHRFRHVRTGPGSFHLDYFHHSATAEVQSEPLSMLACVRVRGGVRTDVRSDVRIGCGEIAINGRPGELLHVLNSSAEYDAVLISMAAALDVARNHPEDEPKPLRFLDCRPVDAAAARQWSLTIDYIADTMRANPGAMTQPLLRTAATHLLAASTLSTFPNTWAAEEGRVDRADATPTTLSRAIGFIEAHAGADIDMTDIARAAHVTLRAVQLAFRRHLDTTPTAYLRQVRLHRAHEQLLAATSDDGTTVSRVAARWGFADASRFTAHYRRTFGQLPSQTLRG